MINLRKSRRIYHLLKHSAPLTLRVEEEVVDRFKPVVEVTKAAKDTQVAREITS